MQVEKFIESQKGFHMSFVDFYETVKSGREVCQGQAEDTPGRGPIVRCSVRVTDGLKVRGGFSSRISFQAPFCFLC